MPRHEPPLSSLFELLPIGAYRSLPDGRQLRANAALVQLNGYEDEASMLAAVNDISAEWYVDPGRREAFKSLIERDGQITDFVSEVYRHKTRERIWVRETAHVVRDASGGVLFYEGVVEDITAAREQHASALSAEAVWKLALEATGDGVWDWHIQTGVELLSPNCKAIYGYSDADLPDLARALDDLTHPDDLQAMHQDRQAHFEGRTPIYVNEHRVRCKDGTWKWIMSRGAVIARDAQGLPLRMIGTHTDITERKRSQALIWQQANFDPLTGLPNRRMLRDRLEQHMRHARRSGERLAILFMDLDHFKEVNDTRGHDQGDDLLKQAAQRIRASLRDSDTVARMGGDEFTVVLSDVPPGGPPDRLLQDMLQAVSRPYQLMGEQAFVSASIGITLFPDDGTDVEALFKNADQALYAAKGAGRNRYSYFTPALQSAAQARARLATDLRSAMQLQQFHVLYQPIVCLKSGAVRKAEALIRWEHPVRGLVSPTEFIALAESIGLIDELGDWVFEQARVQVQSWRERFEPDFQISVNKSPLQFQVARASCDDWGARLAAAGLPGHAIAAEITEGLLLDTHEQVSERLLALRDSGVQVSLDDFGTGYSSLAYLQKFEIDFIKIDQSFVRHLIPDSTDLALCRAIIAMAHALGIRVVAEGVESQQQAQLLAGIGCDFGQGYWFSRPIPALEFDHLLARGHQFPAWPAQSSSGSPT